MSDTDHDWTEETPGRSPWRADYVCADCDHTKTVIRIPVSSIVAFAVLVIVLLVSIP